MINKQTFSIIDIFWPIIGEKEVWLDVFINKNLHKAMHIAFYETEYAFIWIKGLPYDNVGRKTENFNETDKLAISYINPHINFLRACDEDQINQSFPLAEHDNITTIITLAKLL